MTDKLPSKHIFKIQVDNLLLNLFVDNGIKIAGKRLSTSLHKHPYAEIFACKSGEIQIQTENHISVLLPGDIAVVPSGIMHLRTQNTDTSSEWVSIGFSCSECASQSDRDTYTQISRLTEQNECVVYKNQNTAYEIFCNIFADTALGSDPSCLIDFVSILAKLSLLIHSQNSAVNSNKKSKSKNIDRLLKLDYFINQEFMNPLTNDKIANELHIGKRQLSRLVLTHYGTTLHTLLLNTRISAAAKLLAESSDTIENIALCVGFNSKMNFYREFKKTYHMTPAEYRNSVSGKSDKSRD